MREKPAMLELAIAGLLFIAPLFAAGGQITLPDGRRVFALQIEGPPPTSENKK